VDRVPRVDGILGAVSREDVEVVRAIHERWRRGDSARERFDPEIEWSTPHPVASLIRGREELLAFLRRYAGTWQDYRIELKEIRDVGEHRVLVPFSESGRGKGSGVGARVRPTGIWTVRDGRAISFKAYADRTEALKSWG
jgi:ketosteroid isomerase-like protein